MRPPKNNNKEKQTFSQSDVCIVTIHVIVAITFNSHLKVWGFDNLNLKISEKWMLLDPTLLTHTFA